MCGLTKIARKKEANISQSTQSSIFDLDGRKGCSSSRPKIGHHILKMSTFASIIIITFIRNVMNYLILCHLFLLKLPTGIRMVMH